MTTHTLYDSTAPYPRDLAGYGADVPHARWPGGARIAVQFVLNYEEGGENCVLHGDAASETFLSEMFNPAAYPERHLSMESIYEYGSRAGVWRVLREFRQRGLPLTIFCVASALARYPEMARAFQDGGHEIACHALRWIHYQGMDEASERAQMKQALDTIEAIAGERPLGWYTGRDSVNTRRLVVDDGRLLYDSDYYGDDLPFWMKVRKTDGSDANHLVVPYTLDCNDMRFGLPQGYSDAEPFYRYMRDSFDTLYAEGDPQGLDRPKMLSIGLHNRMVGRPGRFAALQRFLDHVGRHPDVWVCRRVDIARHWIATHPCKD
ncbi:MAG: allantoinase PuuE [Burkholderiaceae bacterium]|nr:allantoinase PuuE [Pseudomonadota bacterium]MBS0597078.1 allantoinase PuuE [Pseudomonadota bacterium]MCO5114866.1 allantoinase PuuE [Burkholderiaceae bacterium]MCP5218743.1 allantoinase PuuE [Burkholderiaceae bacterium]